MIANDVIPTMMCRLNSYVVDPSDAPAEVLNDVCDFIVTCLRESAVNIATGDTLLLSLIFGPDSSIDDSAKGAGN